MWRIVYSRWKVRLEVERWTRMLMQKSSIDKLVAGTKGLFFLSICLVFLSFKHLNALQIYLFFLLFWEVTPSQVGVKLSLLSFPIVCWYYRVSSIFFTGLSRLELNRVLKFTTISSASLRDCKELQKTKYSPEDNNFSIKEILKFSLGKNQKLESHYSF